MLSCPNGFSAGPLPILLVPLELLLLPLLLLLLRLNPRRLPNDFDKLKALGEENPQYESLPLDAAAGARGEESHDPGVLGDDELQGLDDLDLDRERNFSLFDCSPMCSISESLVPPSPTPLPLRLSRPFGECRLLHDAIALYCTTRTLLPVLRSTLIHYRFLPSPPSRSTLPGQRMLRRAEFKDFPFRVPVTRLHVSLAPLASQQSLKNKNPSEMETRIGTKIRELVAIHNPSKITGREQRTYGRRPGRYTRRENGN